MAKSKRMFNSNLVNASSFKMKVSNKAKLLYFYIMLNADDKGFCDNADEIIVLLDSNDIEFHNEASLDLLEHGYKNAIQELIDKHLLLVFENKYEDKVYLVRQWYLHNQIPKDRVTETTYIKYLEQVEINSENEYDLIQKPKSGTKTPKKAELAPKIEVHESQPINDEDERVDDAESYASKDKGNDEYDYSKIPDKWDVDACSRAVAIHVKKCKGEPVTPEQQAFLETYVKMTGEVSDDDLPF